jgi:hypothetical protein
MPPASTGRVKRASRLPTLKRKRKRTHTKEPWAALRISGALSAHSMVFTVYSRVLSAILLASGMVSSELARTRTFWSMVTWITWAKG